MTSFDKGVDRHYLCFDRIIFLTLFPLWHLFLIQKKSYLGKSLRNILFFFWGLKLIVNNGIQVSEHSLQILEVGCGVGNTVFPLLNNTKSGHLFVHCCDYSSKAIEILKQNANYNEDVCHAFVWDISKKTTDEIPDESLDIILCIYVISAIPPGLHNKALQNLCRFFFW